MVSNIVVYLYCNQITIIMDLKVAEKLALELMEKHGLNLMVWNFRWDNSKKRFGVCINKRVGGRFGTYVGGTIGLSRALVSINDVEKVTDTILHEIAHALTPGHGHDSVWRRKALEIGSNGNRCFSSEEANIPEMRYQAVCGGCEKVFQKTRMTRTSLNRKESCKCQSGKSWDNRHLLVYKDKKATN